MLRGMHALICYLAGAWSKHIIDFDKHGVTSEAFQSEQVEAEVLDRGLLEYV